MYYIHLKSIQSASRSINGTRINSTTAGKHSNEVKGQGQLQDSCPGFCVLFRDTWAELMFADMGTQAQVLKSKDSACNHNRCLSEQEMQNWERWPAKDPEC